MTRIETSRQQLLDALRQEYEERFPLSKGAHAKASSVLIDGINHGARAFRPYPFRINRADGAYLEDLDGHKIIDFWQGHYANILGHNPEMVRQAMVSELQAGRGLQTGVPDELQTDYALLLARALGADRVRLTTAGTLATMYAVMLARALTGRSLLLKVAGGWHGANPLALKGVERSANGFDRVDSAGVPRTTGEEILVTTFNDVEQLETLFQTHGDRMACFIMELCPSGAGFIQATPEYVQKARELTAKHGALLILDEVITGFRFCASGMGRLYGVEPDLATYGKIIGGGMPLSALAGRADILNQVSETALNRVWFNGGTFSAHPLVLTAGKVMVEHLIAHEDEIYPALATQTDRLREGIERIFAARGILARCTGRGSSGVHRGSLSSVYFPWRDDRLASSAEDLTDPQVCDLVLQNGAIKLGMLLNDVNTVHGLGAVSTRHTDDDVDRVLEAYAAFADRVKEAS